MEVAFSILTISGTIGGAFIGYKQVSPFVLQFLNNNKQYRTFLPINRYAFWNEEKVSKLTSSLIGACVGRYIWPITLPAAIVLVEKYYGQDIRHAINKLNSIIKK